ncbi:MAG: hypothetical protein M3O46_08920 [Myxococcota bacterium]|nr:hypothetical protein [Myxococcota bacterium]
MRLSTRSILGLALAATPFATIVSVGACSGSALPPATDSIDAEADTLLDAPAPDASPPHLAIDAADGPSDARDIGDADGRSGDDAPASADSRAPFDAASSADAPSSSDAADAADSHPTRDGSIPSCSGASPSFKTTVFPILSQCGGELCHGSTLLGPWGGAANAYAQLVNVPSTRDGCDAGLLVSPGHVDNSYLVNKLTGIGMCRVPTKCPVWEGRSPRRSCRPSPTGYALARATTDVAFAFVWPARHGEAITGWHKLGADSARTSPSARV